MCGGRPQGLTHTDLSSESTQLKQEPSGEEQPIYFFSVVLFQIFLLITDVTSDFQQTDTLTHHVAEFSQV